MSTKIVTNIILHLEDERNMRNDTYCFLRRDTRISSAYESGLIWIDSPLEIDDLDQEIERLIQEIEHTHGEGKSVYLGTSRGDVAHKLMEQYGVPEVIVTDHGVPFNGVALCRWLVDNGYDQFHLIGLSNLGMHKQYPQDYWYMFGNGERYFDKVEEARGHPNVNATILECRKENSERY